MPRESKEKPLVDILTEVLTWDGAATLDLMKRVKRIKEESNWDSERAMRFAYRAVKTHQKDDDDG